MHLPDEPVRRLPPRPEDAPDRKPEPPLRGPPPDLEAVVEAAQRLLRRRPTLAPAEVS